MSPTTAAKAAGLLSSDPFLGQGSPIDELMGDLDATLAAEAGAEQNEAGLENWLHDTLQDIINTSPRCAQPAAPQRGMVASHGSPSSDPGERLFS